MVPLVTYVLACSILMGMEKPLPLGPYPVPAPQISQETSQKASQAKRSTKGQKTPQKSPAPILSANPPSRYSLPNIVSLQSEMLRAQESFQSPNNPNLSSWISWPLMIRPTWMESGQVWVDGREFQHAIICMGNPLVLWVGFLAVIVCTGIWIREGSDSARLIALSFLVLWLSWAVIPRKATFFYYYYPATMILPLALVQAARSLRVPAWVSISFLALCALWTVFYLPVLTDQPLSLAALNARILLKSWQPY